jgi:REP element-mobilizing transposase RayT
MHQPPHSKDLRKGRYSQSGQIYLITTVTWDRQPVFGNFHAARILIHALREEQNLGRADTLAFVVMADHLHWLMALREGAALSVVVRAVKAVTAKKLGGALWQRGFHDHALRREEDLVGVARYVVANPVRAGLVARAGDYPHWDAIWL